MPKFEFNKTYRRLTALLLCIALMGGPTMATANTLFGDYVYGMKKAAVLDLSSAGPCADEPANRLSLCATDPVEYLQQRWRLRFSFNNQDELQQVILDQANAGPEIWQKALGAMKDRGWQPAFLETDGAAFDALEQTRLHGSEKALQLQEQFARKAIEDDQNLAIYFIPAAYCEKIAGNRKIKTYDQAIDKADESICVPCMMISADHLKLAFTAPLLSRKNALRYGQMIKRN